MNAATLVASLGWTLLHFLWQGLVLACVTGILLVLLRNSRPERRYAVACAGLLLCLAWPAADLAAMLAGGHGAESGRLAFEHAVAGIGSMGGSGWLPWLQAHLGWIVGAWAACAGALGLRMLLGLAWIDDAARSAQRDAAWQARLSALALRCGLTQHVRLRIVHGLASPVTAGWWRPVVLVPAALLSGMPPQLLEALLAHELGHVKRHDYLVNLLQNLVETLLFYHPAVWWISRRIRAEREQIADDFAAHHLGEPRRLALALSELERLQFSAPQLAQAANGGDLLARIRRLLRPDVQALDWKAALPVLGLLLACAASAHALGGRKDLAPAGTGTSSMAVADFNSCARPHYPQADLDAGHVGTVTLAFLVSAEGKVTDSRIQRSSGYPTLDEAAHATLRECAFRPAREHGRAVRRWTQVQYVWTID